MLCEIWFSKVECWVCLYYTSAMLGHVVVVVVGEASYCAIIACHRFSSCNRGHVSKVKDHHNAPQGKHIPASHLGGRSGAYECLTTVPV